MTTTQQHNFLVIGSGGREHALAWKLAQSPLANHVFVAPGNAGTYVENKVSNIEIDPLDFPALIDFAQSNQISQTIIGPEAPLVAGIVDKFESAGLNCLGPTQAAAQLEGSKAFSKDFLQRHRIPTADYQVFSNANDAMDFVSQSNNKSLVIKADGLAAGKGVIIAHDQNTAVNAIESVMVQQQFGNAGDKVIIEAYLEGQEASYICLVDGSNVLPLATSQDHKARDDGDLGPNTGGMGAYSPAPLITPALEANILQQIIYPTVQGLATEGIHYRGFLYAGLMISPGNDINVLEFNCRLGDPETQPILMRMNSDLASLCLAATSGTLTKYDISWHQNIALGVVIAAKGYPNQYQTGSPISNLPNDSETLKVFHAGTKYKSGGPVTNGGRLLCITTLAPNINNARKEAYTAIEKVACGDIYFRTDIGNRAIINK